VWSATVIAFLLLASGVLRGAAIVHLLFSERLL